MRSRFLFTAGIVGVLSSGVTSRADVDYEREWNPYVTLRGGWLFGGKAKYNQSVKPKADFDAVLSEDKKSLRSAWSGSAEFGCSCFEDRLLIGLELGYFTGKTAFERTENIGHVEYGLPAAGADLLITKFSPDGRCKNFFGACNVTLKKDVGDRTFLFGGIGAGIARTSFGKITLNTDEDAIYGAGGHHYTKSLDYGKKWRFLGQAFAGFGVYLNENWSLTAGYRLRYLSGTARTSLPLKIADGHHDNPEDGASTDFKVKQNILHAAEIGLTYQF